MKSNQKLIFGIIFVMLLLNVGSIYADTTNPLANAAEGAVGQVSKGLADKAISMLMS